MLTTVNIFLILDFLFEISFNWLLTYRFPMSHSKYLSKCMLLENKVGMYHTLYHTLY